MADKKTTSSKTAKPKAPAQKKVSVAFDKEFFEELSQYAQSRGYAVEDYIKKAVKEKLDSDRISSMIDIMSLRK